MGDYRDKDWICMEQDDGSSGRRSLNTEVQQGNLNYKHRGKEEQPD